MLLVSKSVIAALGAFILLVALRLATLAFPNTDIVVSVPTDVIFGCAAVTKLPSSVSALTSEVADRLLTEALPFNINSFVA